MRYGTRLAAARRSGLALAGALWLTACIYSPLKLTAPSSLGGDSTSSGGDSQPGDGSTPADSGAPSDPGDTPACGPVTITSVALLWHVGSNIVIPRPAAPGAILLTASAAGCTTKWVIDDTDGCSTSRLTACYTAAPQIYDALWRPTPAAGPVVTVPFMVQTKDSGGATVSETFTLTFLPTLAQRSRFVGVDSSATGDGQTPDQPARLDTAASSYSESSNESFGLYLHYGAVVWSGGFQAKPGMLLVGSFDDRWGYDPCPSRCGGTADLTWQSTGPSWTVDPLACQSWAHATVWDASTSGGSSPVLSFNIDAAKSVAPSGFAGLTVVADSSTGSPEALVDVTVQDSATPAVFLARDSLLASIDNAAVPLRIGQTTTTTAVAVGLSQVTVAGRGKNGPANGIIINTHLRPGAEITKSCLDLRDLDATNGISPGATLGLQWSSTQDTDSPAPADESLSLNHSALVVNVPARSYAFGVYVTGPLVVGARSGGLKIANSAVNAVSDTSSTAVNSLDLRALDVTGTVVHAQATLGTGVALAIQASGLKALTTTPMRFDDDVLCTHLGGGGSGTTRGLRLSVDGSTLVGPNVYVRNTRIDPPTDCGGPTNANAGDAVGVYLSGPNADGTLAVGGSIVCAGEQTASSHQGVVAYGSAVHIYDSMIGGGPCGGEGAVGSSGYAVEVGDMPSLVIERSWLDSGLKGDLSYGQTDAAIKLWDGGGLSLTSNVLVASSTLIVRGTAWDYAGTDIGYNTALLPDRTTAVGSIESAWGIEEDVAAMDGQIHDNLVVLPAVALASGYVPPSFPSSLSANTYLVGSASTVYGSASADKIIADPPAGMSSVLCVPGPRPSFDPHLGATANGTHGDSLRPIDSSTLGAYPDDIDRQSRSSMTADPNSFRGADAEANDGCPAHGRPLTPVTVDTSTP